ncbi:MAG: OmpA family protein [Ferruginibacter sp.]
MKRIPVFLILALACRVATAIASDIIKYPPFYGSPSYRPLTDTLRMAFEHKQSAIVHKYQLKVLDSVVMILSRNPEVTLSIEGYSYVDEGNDTICKYLSLNRALFIQEAMFGRGIDSSRITGLKAMGAWKPVKRGHYKVINEMPYRTELLLIYPPPPKKPVVADKDRDGIADEDDTCPENFGFAEDKGCPLKDVYFIPFELNQSYIPAASFEKVDKVLGLLKANPPYTVLLAGHASDIEGTGFFTDRLSTARADIIYRYILSRNMPGTRVETISGFGKLKPLNAQQNPLEISENAGVRIIVNKHDR